MTDPAADVMAVKPETFLGHWRDIRDSKNEAGDAATSVARAKKAAKRDGVDLDVVKVLEKLAQMEDDERAAFLTKLETYSKWISLPLGAFSAGITVQEPKNTAMAEFHAWQAGQEGYSAGVGGHPRANNPYKQGSREFVAWDKRWKPGFDVNQKKEAARMMKAARGRPPADAATGNGASAAAH